MGATWEAWKARMEALPEDMCSFEKWLFLHVAGVLFAGKAGELLTLGVGPCRWELWRQIDRAQALAHAWGCSFAELTREESCARIVIYASAAVRKALSETPPWVFEKIGYAGDLDGEAFLAEVGRRWQQSGRIPHEIGLVLGYPVKDVLGFMGLISLPEVGGCGWRIFGDPGPSLRRSRRYALARERAAAFLGDEDRNTMGRAFRPALSMVRVAT